MHGQNHIKNVILDLSEVGSSFMFFSDDVDELRVR